MLYVYNISLGLTEGMRVGPVYYVQAQFTQFCLKSQFIFSCLKLKGMSAAL